MKIKLNHLRLVLRIGLRLDVRVRDFLAPPPGADLALGDIALGDIAALGDLADLGDIAALGDIADLGDIAFCDLEASSVAHLWQINSSCSPSPRVV